MARLRAFIETRGADAARTEEFLPYYALPFVPRPQKHPAFKALFEPKWTIDMRGMLERFVANAPSETPPPRMHSILLHYYGLDAQGAAPSPPRKVVLKSGGPSGPARIDRFQAARARGEATRVGCPRTNARRRHR